MKQQNEKHKYQTIMKADRQTEKPDGLTQTHTNQTIQLNSEQTHAQTYKQTNKQNKIQKQKKKEEAFIY